MTTGGKRTGGWSQAKEEGAAQPLVTGTSGTKMRNVMAVTGSFLGVSGTGRSRERGIGWFQGLQGVWSLSSINRDTTEIDPCSVVDAGH